MTGSPPRSPISRTCLAALLGTLVLGCGKDEPMAPDLDTLAVTTTSLADGVVNVPYSAVLAAMGGDSSYGWSITSGSLPPGLSLGATTGTIAGTPTAVGSSTLTAQVTSGDGQSASRDLTIDVLAPPVLEPSALCSANPGYAIVTFDSPELASAIRQELGVDPAAEVTCDQVGAMTELDAEDYGIGTLVGIQNLVGLVELDLTLNDITDLAPLAGLTGLERLTLDDNMLTTLDGVAALTGLHFLSADYNDLTDIDAVSGLTALDTLDVSDNDLDDLSPVSGLVALLNLDLDRNAFADLAALAGLTALEVLDLDDNQVTDVTALGGLTNLAELYLRDNSALADIQALIDGTGIGAGDTVDLIGTSVSCAAVTALAAEGAMVLSNCP